MHLVKTVKHDHLRRGAAPPGAWRVDLLEFGDADLGVDAGGSAKHEVGRHAEASPRHPTLASTTARLMSQGFFCPATAASAAWNPSLLCVPSQNGFVVEPPQRQSAILGRPVASTLAPVGSKISTSPSTR